MNDRAYNQIQTKQMEVAKESVNQYNIAYDIVNKTYLNKVNALDIVPFQESGFESRNSMNFSLLEVTRIVHGDRKSALENLMNILSTLHPDYGSILVIKSDGIDTHFYIGVRAYNQAKPASSGIKLLMQAMDGSFPGTDYEKLRGEKPDQVLSQADFINCFPDWAIGTAPLVPDLKHENYDQFTQGLERFIDAMYGKKFTAMIIAEPMQNDQLVSLQNGYEGMATALSVYQKAQISTSINESQALSESISKGVTDTLSQSVTLSQSYTDGKSTSESNTKGKSSNRAAVLAGLGALVGSLGGPLGALIGGGIGGVIGGAIGEKNESSSNSYSTNESKTHGDSKQYGSSKSESQTETTGSTDTFGRSDTFSIEQRNKGIERLIGKIDQQLKRIDASKSYGIWNASFYVVAENTESAHIACSLFKGILKGKESAIEDSAIAIWNSKTDNKQTALEYFTNIVHPRLNMNMNRNETPVIVTPSSVLSGKELALLMNFPRKSVSGISVIEMPEFGRNVVYQSKIPDQADTFKLGKVYHYGRVLEDSEIRLNMNSLSMHTFITGSTGSGKTNTINKLIREVMAQNKHFLIIEPSKGEYKELLGGYPDVQVFGTNPSYAPLLKLNPFEFPAKIHVLEHIDRLVEIFNACWPMYAAMPAILKSGIEEVYKLCGWDLEYSICSKSPVLFPTISDLSEILPTIIQTSLYSDELKSNYSGALVTRVNSLNNGLMGLLFNDVSIANETLFDSNCIVDLSRVGSTETKALLMGIVFLKLHEYRQSQDAFSQELKHVTVLEEAHQLLRKTSQEQSQESSNLQGKSVEMITNAIAEMRAYGEGFIIADQAPGLLDPAVIRNTNTKIILKLPEESDRKITGSSAFMTEAQINEIPRFPTGVAAVYQNNWMMPVLCKVALVDDKRCFVYVDDNESNYLHSRKMTSKLLNVLLRDLIHPSTNGTKSSEMSNSENEYNDLIDFLKLSKFKSKTQFVDLLEDMQKGVSNEIMKEQNSYKLSKLLSYIIDYKSILRETRTKSDVTDYDDWTIAVISVLDTKYQLGSEYEKLVLIGLMLEQEKVMSEQGIEFFDNWNNYLRNKLSVK